MFDRGDAFERRSGAERDVDGEALAAEGRSQLAKAVFEIDVVEVELIEDDEACDARLASLFEHLAGVHFDAAMGVDDDDGRFDVIEVRRAPGWRSRGNPGSRRSGSVCLGR